MARSRLATALGSVTLHGAFHWWGECPSKIARRVRVRQTRGNGKAKCHADVTHKAVGRLDSPTRFNATGHGQHFRGKYFTDRAMPNPGEGILFEACQNAGGMAGRPLGKAILVPLARDALKGIRLGLLFSLGGLAHCGRVRAFSQQSPGFVSPLPCLGK